MNDIKLGEYLKEPYKKGLKTDKEMAIMYCNMFWNLHREYCKYQSFWYRLTHLFVTPNKEQP